MKRIGLALIIFSLPYFLLAQPKNFELSNPMALELTDSCIELLTAHKWRTVQIETDVRGNITENEGRSSLQYHQDGTFKYRYTGTWEIVGGKYIKHSFDDNIEKEVNFGGIYAVIELSENILTLSKVLTSSNDMARTMFFDSKPVEPPPVQVYQRKPLFSAPESIIYTGELDPTTIDVISKMSLEELQILNFLHKRDTIYIVAPDSLYRIKRKVL